MSKQITLLAAKMIEYEKDCIERINHFLKVHSFAKMIGELENIDKDSLFILETAAFVHDIGIRASLEKFGHYNAKLQESEGAPVAEKMLDTLSFAGDVVQRVSYLVGHHHTYTNIDGMDYQILVEADFLVNIFENEMNAGQIGAIRKNIFKTRAGLDMLQSMYKQGK